MSANVPTFGTADFDRLFFETVAEKEAATLADIRADMREGYRPRDTRTRALVARHAAALRGAERALSRL